MIQSFYSSEILNFIDCDCPYFESPTPEKFAVAGRYFRDLAEVLDYSSDRWLRNWLNDSYGENEYCEVDADWEDWLLARTQQSVSVAFLAKYDLSTKPGNNYPKSRESPRENNQLQVISEGIDDLQKAIATAHAEDIEKWSHQILGCIPAGQSISFKQLKGKLNLTPAQIYLGIILSNRFIIINQNENDFYSGFSVSLHYEKET